MLLACPIPYKFFEASTPAAHVFVCAQRMFLHISTILQVCVEFVRLPQACFLSEEVFLEVFLHVTNLFEHVRMPQVFVCSADEAVLTVWG